VSTLLSAVRQWLLDAAAGWNRFWFTPADPATLGLVRILAGAMLLYTHLVWSLDLEAFFGPHAWLDARAVRTFYGELAGDGAGEGGASNDEGRSPNDERRGARAGDAADINSPPAASAAVAPSSFIPQPSTLNSPRSYAWSYFYYLDSPAALWTAHVAALVAFALLTLGLWTRLVSILSLLAAVSYANRAPGALFGLDQINLLLAMYLAIGPSGAAYSLDRLLARRRAGRLERGADRAVQGGPAQYVGANIAIRLIQLHMCVIYFFAAIGKLQGPAWHDGTALWLAFANLEYQSLDMTWTAHWPLLVNVLTHVTLYWELSFAALVWPRLTRPLVLALAVPLHVGIAVCLGMPTFGLVMLIGCLAFVPPRVVRGVLRLGRTPRRDRPSRAMEGERPTSARTAVVSRQGAP
jgi:hypothetical protein